MKKRPQQLFGVKKLRGFPFHDVELETRRLTLRPFRESDFDCAVPYYRDPDFLQLMEEEPPTEPVTAGYLRRVGRSMAKQGYLFTIVLKATREAIGEVCLQWMNLSRAQVEGDKVVRSPIGIWDKRLWGRGLGKEVIHRLMDYAFLELGVDRFCAMDVSSDNPRSVGLWTACGLRVARVLNDGKTLDFEIARKEYFDRR